MALTMGLVTSSAFLAVLGVYLLFVALGVWLAGPRLERFFAANRYRGDQEPEGAPRSIYIVLFLISVWSCLIFVVPIALSVRYQVAQAAPSSGPILELWKLFIPLGMFFLFLVYGSSHGLLAWIADRAWPKIQEKEGEQ